MSKTVRATQEKMKAGGHMPFEEFPLKEVDQLVHELDKVKPAGSTVIVTPMEDSHHSPCLKEIIAVTVHTAGKDDQSSESTNTVQSAKSQYECSNQPIASQRVVHVDRRQG
ncbi:hypothetical protein E6H17_06070 [Candidatus Bathyarchaeota archaeon]|nr:MAG: hypothetical protein E6H17_06070 [Candidatus Bathyarchaeota archaeon]